MPHVLLIDDDPAVSLTISRMLAASGYKVVTAESAHEGLQAVAGALPQAIVLDVRMPTVGGMDFLRDLRASAKFSDIPVAVLTGDYFLKDATLSEIAALNARIWYKPLGLDDLDAAMADLLASAPPARPSES